LRTFVNLSGCGIAKPLSVTVFVLLAVILLCQLVIPEALATLKAIQPIQWQAVDQGHSPSPFPIHVLSSFLNPFDTGDQIRLLFRSSSIPPNATSFTQNIFAVNRANPLTTVWLQVRSDLTSTLSPGPYGFIVQATDEDGNTASASGCLLIRPTTNQSCGQTLPQQQQQQESICIITIISSPVKIADNSCTK
jgi:hypothetical protein